MSSLLPTSSSRLPEPGLLEVADSLRHAVLRLSRLLHQQNEGGLSATATATLGSVNKRGPLTLGELAACERVASPTMTKVVEKLEGQGFVTRQVDAHDRRVSRVKITPVGRRHLDSNRAQRTKWLAAQLERLRSDELRRLTAAISSLETIIAVEAP